MDKIDIEKYSKSMPEVVIEEDISNSTDVNDVWKIVTENLRIVLDSVEYKSWFSDTQLLLFKMVLQQYRVLMNFREIPY